MGLGSRPSHRFQILAGIGKTAEENICFAATGERIDFAGRKVEGAIRILDGLLGGSSLEAQSSQGLKAIYVARINCDEALENNSRIPMFTLQMELIRALGYEFDFRIGPACRHEDGGAPCSYVSETPREKSSSDSLW